jgi:hypothetical protein
MVRRFPTILPRQKRESIGAFEGAFAQTYAECVRISCAHSRNGLLLRVDCAPPITGIRTSTGGRCDILAMLDCWGGPLAGWQGSVVPSHMRYAGGVCVLSVGLLMGAGGAIAAADPDTGGSSTRADDGADGSSQVNSPAGSTASNPPHRVGDTLRRTLHGIASAVGSGRTPGQPAFIGAKRPKILSTGTDTTDGKKDWGIAAVSTVVEPVKDGVASVPSLVEPVTDVVASVPSLLEPVTDVVASVPGLPQPVTDVVASVPGLLEPVTDVVASAPGLVATTSSEVITALQDTFTSVVIVPFAQVHPDLLSLFGAGTGPVDGLRGIDFAGLSVAAHATPSQLPQPRPGAGIQGVPLAGTGAVATLGGSATIHVAQHSSLSGTAALTPNGAGPTGVLWHFTRVFAETLVVASLWELAVAALPGVGGLAIFTSAGVRIGYRQAKAGVALQTRGSARFARSGPLGVVHSGSMVVIRRGALDARCLLDNAA